MPVDHKQKINDNQRLINSDGFVIMGILNVTPDSFSDGGRYDEIETAFEHALEMHSQGAQIIDVGGESTRPGAQPVSAQEEIDRIVPVIENISSCCDVLISVDTSKPEVMRSAIEAGASMVNDVNALQQAGAMTVCADFDVPVCLMHMQGEPRTMQLEPSYVDVVQEVSEFLSQRAQDCVDAGIKKEHIIIDPGFGFGKTLEHNLLLLGHLGSLCSLNFPVMTGISRKSMLGKITGCDVDDRLTPGIAAAVMAYQQGGRFFRVHDVKQTKDALLLCEAVENVDRNGESE